MRCTLHPVLRRMSLLLATRMPPFGIAGILSVGGRVTCGDGGAGSGHGVRARQASCGQRAGAALKPGTADRTPPAPSGR